MFLLRISIYFIILFFLLWFKLGRFFLIRFNFQIRRLRERLERIHIFSV